MTINPLLDGVELGDTVNVTTESHGIVSGKLFKIFSFGIAIQSKISGHKAGGGDPLRTTTFHFDQISDVSKV